MRICEFGTSSSRETGGLALYAWARYKRGEIPTQGEYDYINRRVVKKHPNAELVGMSRRFASSGAKEPTEVWWEFKWIVFNRMEGENA